MRVKKYLANTEKEALEQIKSEIGNNAIILDTKKVKKGGFFGLFGKKMLEVTVASEVSNNSEQEISDRPINKQSSFSSQLGKDSSSNDSSEYSIAKEHQFNQLRDIIERRQREYNQNQSETDSLKFNQNSSQYERNSSQFGQKQNSEVENESLQDLKVELNQTKDMMKNMMNEVKQSSFHDKLPTTVSEFYDNLISQDVKEEVAMELVSETMERIGKDKVEDQNKFKIEFKKYLSSKFDISVDTSNNSSKPKIITMIGPTGVGKTTTVAKLAARYTLMEHARVGLITIDTYRIAAVEQLKTYGDILNLPVEVVMTPQELKDSLNKLADKDVVIVDTAGRSHKNQIQMTELKGFIDTCKPDITHLVLSLGTKYKDIQKIIDNYKHIDYDSLILTKTDETDAMGNLINLLWDYQIGCSYLTTGQNVPDDLEEFSLENFLNKMIG